MNISSKKSPSCNHIISQLCPVGAVMAMLLFKFGFNIHNHQLNWDIPIIYNKYHHIKIFLSIVWNKLKA